MERGRTVGGRGRGALPPTSPRRAASRALRRSARWSVRILGLLIALLLVIGVGLGIRTPDAGTPVYTNSQQTQLDAEDRYRSLADAARSAATADAGLAAALTGIATDLEAQADAVALPGRSATTTEPGDASGPARTGDGRSGTGPVTSGAPPGPSAAADPAAPAVPTQVLADLRTSALGSLRAALAADPGPARVLAAAGANQWRHALVLAAALGTDPGLPPADAVPVADLRDGRGIFAGIPLTSDQPGAAPPAPAGRPTAPSGRGQTLGTGDPTPQECEGVPIGPAADRQALLDAKGAEDGARYGYEVAAALLPDRTGVLARAAAHEAAAEAAAEQLDDLCAPAPPARPGFALDPGFRADPGAALRDLEEAHAGLYGGLVPMISPDLRAWAVAAYNAAVQRSVDAGTPLSAFPALPDVPVHDPAPASSGNTSDASEIAPTDGPDD
ncbi:Uncharacterised protein [Arthrobacter agilis]|nr:DUF4439 domain-containing protein [Arthrobacter agilis]OUM40372.1 hypothetical protein B8W74_12625 [Arthrobacter agilis]VDR31673.1 Uncharacterised protein [Arthrobacter agilis]